MDLVIKGKNLEVSQNAIDYIEKKAQKFDRRLQSISKAKVEISEEDTRSKENRYVVEVTVDAKGVFLRGEERGPDIFSAVDAVAQVMERQIRRYKERRQGKKRYRSKSDKMPLPVEDIEPVVDEEEEEEEIKPIKYKRFPVAPMYPDEAIEQMELLGHDFYIFFNAESERFAVVYKRSEGDYGLIEPELN